MIIVWLLIFNVPREIDVPTDNEMATCNSSFLHSVLSQVSLSLISYNLVITILIIIIVVVIDIILRTLGLQ